MSGITTTQSKIAEDLDAFAAASWFTSTYLIAMSSTSPLLARLAQIFSPRACVLVASLLFAIGGILTSQASSLGVFLLGRAIQGIGGAGVMTVSFILVLELAGKKRRGLFIGLVNTGFTTGVSFGAVVAGALLESRGWVSLSRQWRCFANQCGSAFSSGFRVLWHCCSVLASSLVSQARSLVGMKVAKDPQS
jgi:MFS family permease